MSAGQPQRPTRARAGDAAPIVPSARPSPEFVSLAEAAGRYSVSIDTLRRRISSGDLRAVTAGRRLIRVRVQDLDSLFRPIPHGRPRRQAS